MKKFLLISVIALSLCACGKSDNVIPDVAVNFQASISDPRLSKLGVYGGAVLISGYGVAGLIIARQVGA